MIRGPLVVRPVQTLGGELSVPGDKSITHRAYLLALLADGTSRIEAPNRGADCLATLAAAESLGAAVRRGEDLVVITGTGGALRTPAGPIDCGNSGTAMRLLAGVLAGRVDRAVLDGDASLRGRPMDRIVTPLRAMGVSIHGRDGGRHAPLEMVRSRVQPIDYDIPVASAQVLGCVVFAALAASGTSTVALPGPARDHTQRMLPRFGIEPDVTALENGALRVSVHGPAIPRAAAVRVPGDFSSAAFFLAAAAATPGARVCARGVSLNPTRTGLLEVLEAMGAIVERSEGPGGSSEPVGDVTVTGPDHLRAFDVPPAWLPRLIDEVPAWTIAAAAAEGRSRLRGAAELRVKESDRIAVLAERLARLGLQVAETADGLEIEGGALDGGTVDPAGDHRIAMALALLGLRSKHPVCITDAASIMTSYPEFTGDLDALAPGAIVQTGEA